MEKKVGVLIVIIVCVSLVFADDPSEKGVYTSPLTTYNTGFSAGGVTSLSSDLRDKSHNFLKLSWVNSVYFRDYMSLFFDINWYGTGLNFGGDVGIDWMMSKSDFKPFIGAGIGVTHFDKSGDFGDNIGPSGTVHLGCVFEINESVQLRFRVPFTFVVNETRDNCAGVEVGFLFSDKFKRVKKLEYNR